VLKGDSVPIIIVLIGKGKEMADIECARFAVDEEGYCLWGWDNSKHKPHFGGLAGYTRRALDIVVSADGSKTFPQPAAALVRR
jgi:hypothetical protein